MPQGYKTISIKEYVYPKIADVAERTHRTVPGLITHIFDAYAEVLEKLLQGEQQLIIPAELHARLSERAEAKGMLVEDYIALVLRLARKDLEDQ